MKKDFVIKITVLPLALAVVFTLIFVTFFCLRADIFTPVYEGTVISSFESNADTSKTVDKTFDKIEKGDCIGTIKAEKDYPLVADAPYHQLGSVVSYDIGSAEFGKAGYVYLKTDIKVLRELENSIVFRAEGCFEKHDYVLTETKSFMTEYALKSYTPNLNKCAVVYAVDSGKLGLKDSYRVLVFEEVQL